MSRIKKPLFVILISIIVISVYLITKSNISQQEAIEIANSYIENESPSFLLNYIYKIDTSEKKITDVNFPEEFQGIIWYLVYYQDVDTSGVFYINANNGELLKGYVINNADGNITRSFK
ncbi:hypothetical protein H1D32_09605 [Anaerobacillus sp. CMMVII]|uniref:hypothetical protein n=1 Tax=Anaerobacillus sp. CMMVII TaxID=2755588 RepID=UPI0021B771B9|nr:hypothetical protein [Anaerobacillus sp. CMMVII]MCT8137988.1 hypothetical protein [Anaerobacillus sp. CMMVII]